MRRLKRLHLCIFGGPEPFAQSSSSPDSSRPSSFSSDRRYPNELAALVVSLPAGRGSATPSKGSTFMSHTQVDVRDSRSGQLPEVRGCPNFFGRGRRRQLPQNSIFARSSMFRGPLLL